MWPHRSKFILAACSFAILLMCQPSWAAPRRALAAEPQPVYSQIWERVAALVQRVWDGTNISARSTTEPPASPDVHGTLDPDG